MRTVRRLYFYALALIGAEAIVWGAVALLRTVINKGLVGAAGQIATGLSAILVGLPVFLFHWLAVQRDAARDDEERASRVRAVFLYGARAAFLVPLVYSLLAVVNRWMAQALSLPESGVAFGGGQSLTDNLVAIAITLTAFLFFSRTLFRDEQAQQSALFLPETRRLYRYLWTAFGLSITVAGVQSILRQLFYLPTDLQFLSPYLLANGLALVIVGVPTWGWTWLQVQGALEESGERQSILRLLVLHLIVLAGVAGVMAAGGSLLSGIFAWVFGRPQTLAGFLQDSGGYLAAGIPLGVVWIYYGRILDQEMASMPVQPRREAIRRLYHSILSALGMVTVFTGLLVLIELLADLVLARGLSLEWNRISTGLAALGVGLPLWLFTWPALQCEAAGKDAAGDRARRSVIRRAYLYLAIFALLVGAMLAAGNMFFSLLSNLLGERSGDVLRVLLQRLLTLGALAAFLVYHLQALRRDGRAAQQSLGELHAAFPALVLLEDEPGLAVELSREVARQTPRLPLMIHTVEQGAPDDGYLSAKVVVLTAGLLAAPPEPLRLWLLGSPARRLVLPLPKEGWVWLGSPQRAARETARETATAIRQMAEGEALRAGLPSNPWAVAGYILGVLFAIQLLIGLFALVIGSLWR